MKKRVLITGGSRGIGRATVEHFFTATDFDIVFTWQKNEAKAKELCQALDPERVMCFGLDLGSLDMKEAEQKVFTYGPFDIVIHNAGFAQDGPFFFMEERAWDDVIQASLNSFFYLNKAVLPTMIEKRWGRIITLASISGEAGNRGQANYAAAKGAVIAATKSLAKEMGRKGILCNVVSPGLIDTEMTEDMQVDIRAMIPLGRLGTAKEVAKCIGFLASEDASYVNGTVLRVNGGLYT